MADGGDAPERPLDPGGGERGEAPGAATTERVVADALQQLRAVASELRADALECRGAGVDPASVLDAARRVERLCADVLHATGLSLGPASRRVELPRRAGGRARILVVDDDPELREMMTVVLEPSYEVLTAPDGEASLA
ncbi:MAG TPA: response regulator, partial [Anaeromyxobacteraceae bacterium]|nr:response regulator [Anaeromyxobacteraceae bacterium]